jgi:monothiol glutaredoxin
MSVKERIEEQLGSHDVLLYMKGTPDFPQCGFSGQTVAALNAIGKPYAFVNIFEDPEIREGLKEYSNWPTFPQLYVKTRTGRHFPSFTSRVSSSVVATS